MLFSMQCKTLDEHTNNVFEPYVEIPTKSVKRFDLVLNLYFKDSHKGTTRINRGVVLYQKLVSSG